MHHDENNHRHPDHRDQRRRREQHPENFTRDQNFNDFKSRWGEPSPPLHPSQNEWQPRDAGRFDRAGHFHNREEWLPNQRRPQPPRQDYQHGDNSWRQRDVNFDRNNQRAEDRWMQDDAVQHPDDRRRRRRGLPDHDSNWENYERDDRRR